MNDDSLWDRIRAAVRQDEEKQPVFALGIYQGFSHIGDAFWELRNAVDHAGVNDALDDEAMKLTVRAIRFLDGQYKTEMQED